MEVRKFETAEHIDEQIKNFSSTMNALQNITKRGAITPRGLMQLRENVAKL